MMPGGGSSENSSLRRQRIVIRAWSHKAQDDSRDTNQEACDCKKKYDENNLIWWQKRKIRYDGVNFWRYWIKKGIVWRAREIAHELKGRYGSLLQPMNV